MKGNEEASARALESLLTKLSLTCAWKPAYPENDFPDFVFTVSSDSVVESWAVECTELHQYVAHRDKEKSRVGVDREIERLCENIKAKALAGSNRKYLITAMGPNYGVPSSVIEQRALHYIESGRTEREALDIPEIDEADPVARAVKERVAVEQAKVHIETLLSPVPIVYGYGLDGSTMNADGKSLSADVDAVLRYALTRILDDKLPKLAQCTSFKRRILLIWLGYWLAEPAQVRESLDALNWNRSSIDTVLVVLPDGNAHWVADPGQVFVGEA